MFILNKKTGVTSECTNPDVIKYCKKNAEDFEVTESRTSNVEKNSIEQPTKQKPLEKMKVDELRAFALEKEIDVEGFNKEEMLKVIKDILNGSNQ